jgi:hypothetical protein
MGGLKPIPQLGPTASRAFVSDGNGKRLTLPHQHDEPLSSSDAGIKKVARQHCVVLRRQGDHDGRILRALALVNRRRIGAPSGSTSRATAIIAGCSSSVPRPPCGLHGRSTPADAGPRSCWSGNLRNWPPWGWPTRQRASPGGRDARRNLRGAGRAALVPRWPRQQSGEVTREDGET